MNSPEDTNAGPVIRDLRRIDPVTGQVRDPGQQGRREPDSRVPGKPRPGRHAASKPGGTGARPAAAQPAGGAAGGPPPGPGAPGPGAPGPGAPGAGGPPPGGPQIPGSGRAAPGGPGPAAQEPAGPAHPGQAPGGATPAPSGPLGGPDGAGLAAQLAERTADLQRLQAEYANYRKRVERDRLAVREQALANVLSALLPVLDDIGRAREHGDSPAGSSPSGNRWRRLPPSWGWRASGTPGSRSTPGCTRR